MQPVLTVRAKEQAGVEGAHEGLRRGLRQVELGQMAPDVDLKVILLRHVVQVAHGVGHESNCNFSSLRPVELLAFLHPTSLVI